MKTPENTNPISVINHAVTNDFKDHGPLSGVEFLRAAVRSMDSRAEFLNEDKTPVELLKDYALYLTDENYDWFSADRKLKANS